MAVIIDGTSGVSTPGVTDTGNLSVAGSTTLTTPLPVASGGTGATSLSGIAVGNLTGGSAGTIPYQSTVGTTAMLATGTSGQVLTSAGALAAPVWTTLAAPNTSGGATVTNPMSTNITLTSSSNRVQVLTPDAQSRRIILPDATTISAAGGPIFVLQNTVPWYPVAVMDSAGNNVGWVVADYESRVYLTSTASATGNWVIKTGNASADAGVYPYDTPYFASINTSWIGRTYAMALSTDLAEVPSGNSTSYVQDWAILTQSYAPYRGLGGNQNTQTCSVQSYGTRGACVVSSTMTFHIYADTGTTQNYCYVLSYNPTTGGQTKGAELSLGSYGGSVAYTCMAVDSTHVLVGYSNSGGNYFLRMISISGTTCTAGTATGSWGPIQNQYTQVSVLSSTLAHFAYGSSIWDLTLNTGANTITVNSGTSTTGSIYGIVPNSSTSSMVFYDNGGNRVIGAVVTSSGGTPTLGTASGVLTGTADINYGAISSVKAGTALIILNYTGPNSTPLQFALVQTVSGVPTLKSRGTLPGSSTSLQTFLSFSSGLGVAPIQWANNAYTNLANFSYQKIAVTGGI